MLIEATQARFLTTLIARGAVVNYHEPSMNIETGNLSEISETTTPWVVGWDPLHAGSLRYVPADSPVFGLCLKFSHHSIGDIDLDNPVSAERSLAIILSGGPFRFEFAPTGEYRFEDCHTVVLAEPGDFVCWGPGVWHRWFADKATTIATMRWRDKQLA